MTPKEKKWHVRFLRLAKEVSTWSIDPSTKVGCILVKNKRVISTGYNGFPKNISDNFDRLLDREKKYEITVHAEVNAVTTAALHGVSTEGSIAYVSFSPCSRCAAVLINAGISEVYVTGGSIIPDRWLSNFITASTLLAEAGVGYEVIDIS
jgi:dCMP deaminase|tara:strand:+ start:1082 stop:1534 length:453 start_codon:yes stop_codon:yes gene_type:complete